MHNATLARTALRSLRLRSGVATVPRRFGSGEPQYEEPTGNLFNEPVQPIMPIATDDTVANYDTTSYTRQPLAPGTKRVKENWENWYYYGLGGAFLFGGIALYYKPKQE